MASLPLKFMGSIGVLVVVFAAALPADAAKGKYKKHVAAHTAPVSANSRYRGTNLFPAGPVCHANDYLGDDPIRSSGCSCSAISAPITAAIPEAVQFDFPLPIG